LDLTVEKGDQAAKINKISESVALIWSKGSIRKGGHF
jgi:hypothetical protein